MGITPFLLDHSQHASEATSDISNQSLGIEEELKSVPLTPPEQVQFQSRDNDTLSINSFESADSETPLTRPSNA